jgi:hypothetical protein
MVQNPCEVPTAQAPQVYPRHDYRISEKESMKGKCAVCEVAFADHEHRVAYLQRVIAVQAGLKWARLTMKTRQACKDEAQEFIRQQQERKNGTS